MKNLLLFLLLCFFLLLTSCGGGLFEETMVPESEFQSESKTESDALDVSPRIFYDYTINDVKPSNGIIEKYYIDDLIEGDLTQAINEYASSDTASEDFKRLLRQASTVETLPILGAYLEYTSLKMCMFYEDDTLIGIRSVVLENTDGLRIKEEFSTVLNNAEGRYDQSRFIDEYCYSWLSECIASYPDFDIQGLVYEETPYRMVYPIGIQTAESPLTYYLVELLPFRKIEPFFSIEEGQDKFGAYWQFRAELMSRLPLYKWVKTLSVTGYINPYCNEDVFLLDLEPEAYAYLYDWDDVVVIPLLDENGEEGKYVLHLLYHRTTLIAELLLDNTGDHLVPCLEIISPIDPSTGAYIGLSQIDYTNEMNRLWQDVENDASVRGVGYDGEKYFLIMD